MGITTHSSNSSPLQQLDLQCGEALWNVEQKNWLGTNCYDVTCAPFYLLKALGWEERTRVDQRGLSSSVAVVFAVACNRLNLCPLLW